LEITDYGVRIYSIRKIDAQRNYVRLTNFVLPNLCAFKAGDTDGYTVNWHVAIDDTHHWKYVIQFQRERAINVAVISGERNDVGPDFRLARQRANRYLQDRSEMRNGTFAGLGKAFQAQDLCVTEGEGGIQDRTQEHPGSTDVAVLAARQMLLQAIDAVEAGDDPPHVLRSTPDVPGLLAISDVIPSERGWRRYWEQPELAVRR
jgi:phthalate 4,5-dioxygenase